MVDTPVQQGDVHLSAGSSMTVAALGVVFGDIGTSPLYAVRQSLIDFADMSEHAILGALSLIVWALVLIVMVKYVVVIMRADNRGEGGLLALTPVYGFALLIDAPGRGFFMLGAVFLAVTGAETLYADMGHFGRNALRTAWVGLVFPALLLNYFGQGALLLGNPGALEHPFYRLAPEWGLYPLVGLATAATIIASQAVISGAFSITRQAVQLGYLPRLEVRHTSEQEIGQVYVPRINSALLVAVIILVIGFRSSDNLGAAYGIAVSGMMAITTGLAFLYMRSGGWSLAVAIPVFAAFAIIDLTFFSANLLKIAEGGWFPVVVAIVVFTIMGTWWRGRRLLAELRARDAMPLQQFVEALKPDRPARVPGTAIFMSRDLNRVPVGLLHALKHYKVLHA